MGIIRGEAVQAQRTASTAHKQQARYSRTSKEASTLEQRVWEEVRAREVTSVGRGWTRSLGDSEQRHNKVLKRE